jgi:hypothetical protein
MPQVLEAYRGVIRNQALIFHLEPHSVSNITAQIDETNQALSAARKCKPPQDVVKTFVAISTLLSTLFLPFPSNCRVGDPLELGI